MASAGASQQPAAPLEPAESAPEAEAGSPVARVQVRYLASHLRGTGQRVSYSANTRHSVTQSHEVDLYDGRRLSGRPEEQLARQGFALVSGFRSAVHEQLGEIQSPQAYHSSRFSETDASRAAREVYFAECERLVQSLTGADVTFCISHTARDGTAAVKRGGVEYLTTPAQFAHADYTPDIMPSAWKMLVKRGLPEDVARRARCTFHNVWQPTLLPVEKDPLAVLDWNSVDPKDVMTVTLGYAIVPSEKVDGAGKLEPPIAQLLHSPDHKWYFFPHMKTDEAIVFTQLDVDGGGRARQSFHTAVRHAIKADPTARRSVEVRVIGVFLDPQDKAQARPTCEPQAKL